MTRSRILLLHGAYMDADALAPLSHALRLHGLTVLAADLNPPRPGASMRYQDQARRLWRAHGRRRPTLLGYSMGAGVALQCLLDWPVPPSALVLIGAGLGPASGPNSSAARARRGITPAATETFLETMVRGWFARRDDRRAGPMIASALALGPERFARTREALVAGISGEGRLRPGMAPALVIHGPLDRNRSETGARRLASRLGAPLVLLPGAGHAAPIERAGEIAMLTAGLARDRQRRRNGRICPMC